MIPHALLIAFSVALCLFWGGPLWTAGREASLVGRFAGSYLLNVPVLAGGTMSAAQAAAVALTALPAAARGISLLLRQAPSGAGVIPLRIAAVLPRRGLGLGLATGILPCGLLVTAFAMAAATASPFLGAATMAAFSIGSAPGLLIALLGRGLAERLKVRISPRMEGLLWCGLAGCAPGDGGELPHGADGRGLSEARAQRDRHAWRNFPRSWPA